MFEDADNFADLFRGGLPYYLLITLPILIICSSNPVLASSEFAVQRMSQFDVHGVPYGCRGSAMNLEAKSLYTWTTSRHCIVTKFQDLTIEQFRDIRSKAGGLVIMFSDSIVNLSFEERQHVYLLEQAMMAQEITIPVYFSAYNKELEQIIEDLTKNRKNNPQKRESAASEIINSISANGYQAVISGASHAINKQSKIPIIQGELAPIKSINKMDDSSSKQPIILIVAHLDTFGLVNEHLANLDAAILLTIADLFSKLYNTMNTSPKYRLMFLLSESGLFLNFQGMKKWLDTNLDENIQIQNPEFVLCLDSVGQNNVDQNLYMHVSKPPKDGTAINNFYKQLKIVSQQYGNHTLEGVHKKINLADTLLAWEHERFSMKRIPAFTISSLRSHKDSLRTTMFDENIDRQAEIVQNLGKIIAESLARYIYNIQDGEIFSNSMDIQVNTVKPWLNMKSTMQNNDVKNYFEKYLKNVKIIYEKPDQREPDFMLYDGHEATLNVYNVKPAVFDLFLTFLIASYLGIIYIIIYYFPKLYVIMCKFSLYNYDKVKVN